MIRIVSHITGDTCPSVLVAHSQFLLAYFATDICNMQPIDFMVAAYSKTYPLRNKFSLFLSNTRALYYLAGINSHLKFYLFLMTCDRFWGTRVDKLLLLNAFEYLRQPPLISLSSSLVQSIKHIKWLKSKIFLLHRSTRKFSCLLKHRRTNLIGISQSWLLWEWRIYK